MTLITEQLAVWRTKHNSDIGKLIGLVHDTPKVTVEQSVNYRLLCNVLINGNPLNQLVVDLAFGVLTCAPRRADVDNKQKENKLGALLSRKGNHGKGLHHTGSVGDGRDSIGGGVP